MSYVRNVAWVIEPGAAFVTSASSLFRSYGHGVEVNTVTEDRASMMLIRNDPAAQVHLPAADHVR